MSVDAMSVGFQLLIGSEPIVFALNPIPNFVIYWDPYVLLSD